MRSLGLSLSGLACVVALIVIAPKPANSQPSVLPLVSSLATQALPFVLMSKVAVMVPEENEVERAPPVIHKFEEGSQVIPLP